MTITEEMETKLRAQFSPEALEIINESALHQGHAGDDGSGESHFRIRIQVAEFSEMSRIKRHRAIHAALGPALIARIHALAIEIVE